MSFTLLVNNGGVETLGLLDVDGLHVGVELLLGVLLVVTLTRDAHTQTEWDTLDTGFPDLLVQLGVETDVLGALVHTWVVSLAFKPREKCATLTIAFSAKARTSLIARGARFLKVTPWHYSYHKKRRNQSSARMPCCVKKHLIQKSARFLVAIEVDFIKLILLFLVLQFPAPMRVVVLSFHLPSSHF